MSTHTDDPADPLLSAGSSAVRDRVEDQGRPPLRSARSRRGAYAVVLLGLLAAVLVRALWVETFFVPDAGMAPTLAAGDRVLVAKGGPVARGDVVVAEVSQAFAGPSRATHTDPGIVGRTLSTLASALGVAGGGRSVVARVVAVGGDTVTCSGDGRLVVGSTPVSGEVGCSGVSVRVPPNGVWVLGDDPRHALDSWSQIDRPGQGLLTRGEIVGTVWLRWWPLPDAGRLPAVTR